jgi:hypothetical protein
MPHRKERKLAQQPLFRANRAGFAMRNIWTFSIFPPWKGNRIVQTTGVLDHPTLGASRSYQGMNDHHEATIGAIVDSALRATVAYQHKPRAQLAAFKQRAFAR